MIRTTSVHSADTALALRARELLAEGPLDSVSLVAQVCQMSGTPAIVAEHLATTLFADRSEFTRDPDGRWRLAGTSAYGPEVKPARVGEGFEEYVRHKHREPNVSPGLLTAAAMAAQPELPFVEVAGQQLRAPAVQRRTGTALHSLDFMVVDVETTGGGSLKHDRITEIAAIHVREGEIVDEFETLINPQRSIPPMISALTNITWEMVSKAPLFRDICDRLVPLLDGKVFVAHNAEYDWRFVTTEIHRATGQRLEGERLCTVRLARALKPELRSRRLDVLAHYYGITIERRHRAGDDARATARLLIRFLKELEDRDCVTFETMRELMYRRGGRRRRGRRGRSAMPRGMDRDTSA